MLWYHLILWTTLQGQGSYAVSKKRKSASERGAKKCQAQDKFFPVVIQQGQALEQCLEFLQSGMILKPQTL
jgi:hypothetical protein